MTVSTHSAMNPKIRNVLSTLAQIMGVDINIPNSRSFKASIESTDGQNLNFKLTPLEQGDSMRASKQAPDLVIATSGGADLDGAVGTTTLVESTKDVTVPAPSDGGVAVPVGSTIYASVTTEAGVRAPLEAIRIDDSTIRIFSAGGAFPPPLSYNADQATLVAGTLDITTAVAPTTTMLYAAELLTAGGSGGARYSAFRKDADEVTAQAHTSAGALATSATPVVRVHQFPAGIWPLNRGEGTLVAGVNASVACANVAGDILVPVHLSGTAAHHYSVLRVSDTLVSVMAHTVAGALDTASVAQVRVLNMGPAKVGQIVLVAGTRDLLLTVAAADVLVCQSITAGGTPGVKWTAIRKDADEVTIQAFAANNAAAALDTSVIRVTNLGQASVETSLVRWAVVRP